MKRTTVDSSAAHTSATGREATATSAAIDHATSSPAPDAHSTTRDALNTVVGSANQHQSPNLQAAPTTKGRTYVLEYIFRSSGRDNFEGFPPTEKVTKREGGEVHTAHSARHHAIPAHMLRKAVRYILQAGLEEEPRTRAMLLNAANRYRPTQPDGQKLLKRLTEDSSWSIVPDEERPPGNIPVWEAVSKGVFALPGNLFLGPEGGVRSDDPGKLFESKAKDAFGNDWESITDAVEAVEAVVALGDRKQQGEPGKRAPSAQFVIAAAKAGAALGVLTADGRTIRPYKPDIWEVVLAPGGIAKWRLRASPS